MSIVLRKDTQVITTLIQEIKTYPGNQGCCGGWMWIRIQKRYLHYFFKIDILLVWKQFQLLSCAPWVEKEMRNLSEKFLANMHVKGIKGTVRLEEIPWGQVAWELHRWCWVGTGHRWGQWREKWATHAKSDIPPTTLTSFNISSNLYHLLCIPPPSPHQAMTDALSLLLVAMGLRYNLSICLNSWLSNFAKNIRSKTCGKKKTKQNTETNKQKPPHQEGTAKCLDLTKSDFH